MSLIIYKSPPALVFSGNPIIFGVQDENQLASNLKQRGVVRILATLPPSGHNVPFTLTYLETYTFSIRVGSEDQNGWTQRIINHLLTIEGLVEKLSFQVLGSYLYFIEREPLADLTMSYAVYGNPNNSSIVLNSSTINSDEFHAIGVRPAKVNILALSTADGEIETINNYYGEGEEIESLPRIVQASNALSERSDQSMFIEHSVSNLVKDRTDGHFTINLDYYKIHDLAQKFAFLFYAKKGTPATFSEYLWSDPIYVIQAEVSKAMQAKLNEQSTTLYDALVTSKQFLTWAPTTKTIDIYHPERLYFLIKTAGAYRYFVKKYYTDLSDTTVQLTSFNAQQFQVVEISAAFLSISDEEVLPIAKFEVWLEDDSSNIVSELRTYLMDYNYQANPRWWMFKNDFGVYECIRTTGIGQESVDIDKKFVDKQLPDSYTRTDKDFEQVYSSTELLLKCSSGPLTKALLNTFAEFLDSEDAYLLNKGKAIPAQINKGKYKLSKDRVNLTDISFSARLMAIDEESIDLTQNLPVAGDWNNDFNESFS